jgi:alpha-N-arabinofuranosidase
LIEHEGIMKRSTCLLAAFAALPAAASDAARFNWFEYTGRDAAYDAPLPRGSFHNPILAGYYPDPSITRVGDRFYLVNSTFAHWPGIPIHESTDLVHWKLVGHALADPAKVSFDQIGTSRGVFAPAIDHHDGSFYVVNTLVDAGGNFFVTAKNPAGPWSDPVWLPEIDGIDPAFFFDTDGKAYIVNNGPPVGPPLYNGHRAIWIEGPHLYHIGEWYFLMCAEGGTDRNHSEVIFRSKSPWGPFEPFADNPILTQRDLPADRASPVTNAGHADLVQMKDGSWWAVFLASRPYRDYLFNTGRETFLLPVTWKDGWPVILGHGQAIPLTLPGPRATTAGSARGADALSGNFTKREEFDGKLGPEWITVHVPKSSRAPVMDDGRLLLSAVHDTTLADKRHAGFLARRQQHQNFDATTELVDSVPGIEAGLAAFQNESHWYFLGVREHAPSGIEVFLRRAAGGAAEEVASTPVAAPTNHAVKLRITGAGPNYSFLYDAGAGWRPLRENEDGTMLSTEKAGGFVGTVIGPYAQEIRIEP